MPADYDNDNDNTRPRSTRSRSTRPSSTRLPSTRPSSTRPSSTRKEQQQRPARAKTPEELEHDTCKEDVWRDIMKECTSDLGKCPIVQNCYDYVDPDTGARIPSYYTTADGTTPLIGSQMWPLDRHLTPEEKKAINELKDPKDKLFKKASRCLGRQVHENYGSRYTVCDELRAKADAARARALPPHDDIPASTRAVMGSAKPGSVRTGSMAKNGSATRTGSTAMNGSVTRTGSMAKNGSVTRTGSMAKPRSVTTTRTGSMAKPGSANAKKKMV